MENKKSLVALALVALVGVIGATFAYFTSSTTLNNEFVTGTYSTSVTEEFISPDNWTPGTTTTKKVNVTNNGSVEVAVRATYTEKWTAKDGTVLSGTRNDEQVAQFTIGSDWEAATDRYYYYKGTLASGQTSSDFISEVTFNPNFILEEGTDIECTTKKESGKTIVNCANLESGYAGATYSLDITIETIQADQKWSHFPLKEYNVGEVITIDTEIFNVISDNGYTVTLLAQNNLNANYRQTEEINEVGYADSCDWPNTPAPREIDIQLYDGNVKTYVNEYTTYLKGETGDTNLSGDLITMKQLKSLQCTINDDYTYTKGLTCVDSEHAEWLVNGQYWWTSSSYPTDASRAWIVTDTGILSYGGGCWHINGIRPTITISKDALANL